MGLPMHKVIGGCDLKDLGMDIKSDPKVCTNLKSE